MQNEHNSTIVEGFLPNVTLHSYVSQASFVLSFLPFNYVANA